MTDREKMLKLLDKYRTNSIEAILSCFLGEYEDDIPASTICRLIDMLNHSLAHKIEKFNNLQNNN